jgi:hypothetical protein
LRWVSWPPHWTLVLRSGPPLFGKSIHAVVFSINPIQPARIYLRARSKCTSTKINPMQNQPHRIHQPPCGFVSSVVVLLLLLTGALQLKAANARPRADLSRLVVIGDSLAAGYQNSSLLDRQQTNGLAALIARQARTELSLPLIAEPGFPSVLTLVDVGPPPQIVPASGTSTGRVDLFTQTMNLAVPGQRVADALEQRPDFPIDSMTDLVLGLPGLLGGVSRSQVEWAEELQPTTIIAWIGSMDALGAAIAGDTSVLTPAADFEAGYSNLVKRLAATGATVVVANIPDVSVIPFVVPVPEAAALFGVPLDLFTAALGVSAHDFITLDNVGQVMAILMGLAPGPLTDPEFLDAGEVQQIREATAQFNEIIAAQASANNAVLVDTHALLNRLDRRGLAVGGRRLTTRFLGGIFSLDGIHPTNTGAAATANLFIKTMNRQVRAGIRPVNVRRIQKQDPLVLPRTR